MKKIQIDILVGDRDKENPNIRYLPCFFDPNFLTYYIVYEDMIGFMIGSIQFRCEKNEENLQKLEEAFESKRID